LRARDADELSSRSTKEDHVLLKKILVPLDGSELAARILVHARRLLHAPGSTVTLLRVVPRVEDVETAALVLEEARERLTARGIPATARVVMGEPARKIAQIAEESGASLIALSTHGASGIMRALRGSVAEELLTIAPVPVLLANPFALRENEELPIRKIVIGLDGSKRSARALPIATEIARLYGAELVLLHVVDLSWCHYPEVARPHELAQAEQYLARELEHLDVRARSCIVEGTASEKILEVVEAEKADLLMLASHGRSGVARWYYGSVAELIIRQARCPILVVRSGAEVPARTPAAKPIPANV
jgi:nucleotide-binding universal stress UspA family protein